MAGPKIGSRVRVEKSGFVYEGVVLPSTEENILMIKLDNGYNVGFKLSDVKVKIIGKGEELEKFPELKVRAGGKPKVSLISTGGTITSRVDYRTGAVRSLSKAEQLLFNIPELTKIVDLKLYSPFSVMSEDMGPAEWQRIAEIVARELRKSEGVIVTHGTDTLHFTAAALSFMLQGLNKPVALVGGQRSSDRGSFDGAQNLICAAHYSTSNIAEVSVVMHGTISDDFCYAIRGTRVRKMHTSRRDAFRPINELPIAKIWPDGKIEHMSGFRKRGKGKVVLKNSFEPKVALIKVFPGSTPDVIDFYIERDYKGIIIEGTGLGHVPAQPLKEELSWLKSIERAVKMDVFVGITSQCLYGRTDPFVYDSGRLLHSTGAVHLGDMLPETAYVKLGWVLGQTRNPKEIRELMLKNLAGEISDRSVEGGFLV